jgi:hypothetical protein
MPESHLPAASPAERLMSRTFENLAFLCGVALPLVALGVELTTRMNASTFFVSVRRGPSSISLSVCPG